MSDGTYLHLTQAILIAHQRRNTTSCLCGWAQLGHSHASHVADLLDQAGALRTRPPAAASRLREALASLVRAVERLDERPFASEASVLIDAYRHARATLQAEDGGQDE